MAGVAAGDDPLGRHDQEDRMGTIVAGTDGSAGAWAALEAALELAHESNDTLVVVTAWRELRGDFGLPDETLLPSLHLADIEREWADRTLADAMAAAEEAGVEATLARKHGEPAAAICEVARENDARLIVVGAHGWGRLEGVVFGSVSAGVISRVPCPVLVIPNASVRREVAGAFAAEKGEER
jgi:nucleotide-binding universal stress UspA family protein